LIAILLYLIGLVSAVVAVVLVGFDAPPLYTAIMAAYNSGGLNSTLPALGTAVMTLSWALTPFLGGLVLMGFARIIVLLAGIRRALKGPA
jgi:hypothetical protein